MHVTYKIIENCLEESHITLYVRNTFLLVQDMIENQKQHY